MSQVTERPRRGGSNGGNGGNGSENGSDTNVAPVSPKELRRARKRRRRPTWLLFVAGFALAGLSIVGGKMFAVLNHIAKSDKGGQGNIVNLLDSISNPAGQFPNKDRVNILLIGKDYDRDKKGMPFTKHSRSDSIVMLSVDVKKASISALSIPRDTRVEAPDGRVGKINDTFARGGEKLLIATVGQLLGVTPDYFVALKPDSLKAMVDNLGGVDVVALDDMNYDDSWGQLHIHLKKGPLHLTGQEAIGFTRFREVKAGTKHSKEEGDPRRMARQQMVIRALASEAKSPKNWARLDQVIEQCLAQVETNLSQNQVFALGSLLRSLQPDQIQSASLVGHGTPRHGGTYFFYPDERKTQAMVAWLLKGDETAANRLTVVEVENGTAVKGLARRVADKLREQGFDARSAGTAPPAAAAPGGVAETRVVYGKAAVQSRAERISKMLGGVKLEKQAPPAAAPGSAPAATVADAVDPDAPDVTVVLGRDIAANFAERSAKL